MSDNNYQLPALTTSIGFENFENVFGIKTDSVRRSTEGAFRPYIYVSDTVAIGGKQKRNKRFNDCTGENRVRRGENKAGEESKEKKSSTRNRNVIIDFGEKLVSFFEGVRVISAGKFVSVKVLHHRSQCLKEQRNLSLSLSIPL